MNFYIKEARRVIWITFENVVFFLTKKVLPTMMEVPKSHPSLETRSLGTSFESPFDFCLVKAHKIKILNREKCSIFSLSLTKRPLFKTTSTRNKRKANLRLSWCQHLLQFQNGLRGPFRSETIRPWQCPPWWWSSSRAPRVHYSRLIRDELSLRHYYEAT